MAAKSRIPRKTGFFTAWFSTISISRFNNDSIEVKSGVSGTLKNLHLLLRNKEQIEEGIVFSLREFSVLPERQIRFMPIYFAGSSALTGRLD